MWPKKRTQGQNDLPQQLSSQLLANQRGMRCHLTIVTENGEKEGKYQIEQTAGGDLSNDEKLTLAAA